MTLLQMSGIEKSFAHVQVLKQVRFTLEAGEIHALLGENGAGKSTLIKILSGGFPADQGKILIDDKEVTFQSPRAAMKAGIGVIHQELHLVPQLSICENLFLGREHSFGFGWIRWRKMKEEARHWLKKVGLNKDPFCKVGGLSVGQQQLVEIAKALSLQAKILILDEPTAALTPLEVRSLFATLRALRGKGVGMIYISHRLEEVQELSDRITVLRNGEIIATHPTHEIALDHVVQMMVGRDLAERFPQKTAVKTPVDRLRVKGLTQTGVVEGVSFHIQAGEVLGLAGLIGAGRTELANLLFGVSKRDAGEIWLDGKPATFRHPREAVRLGMAYVTEDRKGKGLVLTQSVKENLSLVAMNAFTTMGVITKKLEEEQATTLSKQLGIRATSLDQPAAFLSGGNQQKVAIGKWLVQPPKVLILDEPTRGVDIGAKQEIYQLMNQLSAQGVAILLISSDLPEVLGMSDRVMVMRKGKQVATFTQKEATEQRVLEAAAGGGGLLAEGIERAEHAR
ncbi:sugar ABC transporter ATP-binding protein [Marininema halotolerans]|uniref:Ribose transport system ATP-binding protein n=1 Tax=Marininema halotolerans TaxID=1155944 RepID=A0A1I6PN58_9BACL|nr:sugar ABC transporter ATP-binding protein [Marininema halotolerans]SFS41560.1 ribose transport system ATP-binding protein [Marininema halotolerans]